MYMFTPDSHTDISMDLHGGRQDDLLEGIVSEVDSGLKQEEPITRVDVDCHKLKSLLHLTDAVSENPDPHDLDPLDIAVSKGEQKHCDL